MIRILGSQHRINNLKEYLFLKKFSFSSRFPIETNNPVSYGLAAIEQYFTLKYVFLLLATMLSMEVESFFLVVGLAKDSKFDLKLMND